MRLSRGILKISTALSLILATSGCTRDATRRDPPQVAAAPVLDDLLTTLEDIELSRARGLTLVSLSPDTLLRLDSILDRTKASVTRLRLDIDHSMAFQALVQARDDLRNLLLLSEDNDIMGVLRDRLEAAVLNVARLQGKKPYEWGDANVYREIYSQNFGPTEQLGDFFSFAETRTEAGSKLFLAGRCDFCRNPDYIGVELQNREAVWLVSPRIQLPDAPDLKLVLNGSTRGDVSSGSIRGLRVFVSESFSGLFTKAEDNWTEITASIDRYPANNTSFRSFTSNLWLDAYRGRSVSFALRAEGVSTKGSSVYQLQNFGIFAQGTASVLPQTVSAPEPLLLTSAPRQPVEPSVPPKDGGRQPPPGPSTPVRSGFPDCKPGPDGRYLIDQSCRFAFDSQAAVDALLRYNSQTRQPEPDSPFRKFNKSGKTMVATSPTSGWKFSGCEASLVLASNVGLCANRLSASGAADLLLSPKLSLGTGRYALRVYSSFAGRLRNDTDGDGNANVESVRTRVLMFDSMSYNEAEKKLYTTDFSKVTSAWDDNSSISDLALDGLSTADLIDAKDAAEFVAAVSPDNFLARLPTEERNFQLGFLLHLRPDQKFADNKSTWYLYEIAFEKVDGTPVVPAQ